MNSKKLKKYQVHILAWAAFFSGAIVIGCGDGSGGSFDIESESRSASVNTVELADNVHVLPSDGSLIVTAFGQDGIQFLGDPVDYVEPGHYMVVAAPITDAARAQINHIGGFVTLQDGSYIVPRDQLPTSFHAPGNEGYDYFLIHYAEAGERVIETGESTVEGARAYAAPSRSSYYRGVFSSVTHGISSVAHHVTHSVTHGITSAAQAAAKEATHAEHAVASEATSIANSVGNSIGDITKIDKALSTLRSFGGKFKKIVKNAEFVVKDAVDNPTHIIKDAVSAAEFIITGNADASFSDNGEFSLNLADVDVERSGEDDGKHLAGTFNGSLKYKHAESTEIKFKDHEFDWVRFGISADVDADIQLTNVTGSGEIKLASYDLSPIVLDAGIPIVVIRNITVYARIGMSIPTNIGIGATVSGSIKGEVNAHHFLNIRPEFDAYGSATFPKVNELLQGGEVDGNVSFHVTSEMKLYDVAGPYIDFNLLELTLENKSAPENNDIDYTLSGSIDLGASLEELGYSLAQTEKTVVSKTFKEGNINPEQIVPGEENPSISVITDGPEQDFPGNPSSGGEFEGF